GRPRGRTSDGGGFLIGQIGVVAVDGPLAVRLSGRWVRAYAGADEDTAGCDLCHRVIVHEHERGIDLVIVVDVVVGEGAGVPALVGPHVIVQRTEVEEIGAGAGNEMACRRIYGQHRREG